MSRARASSSIDQPLEAVALIPGSRQSETPWLAPAVAGPVDARAEANALGAIEETLAVRAPILESNEIIELSIKPSRWFILIVSLKFIALCVGLAAGLAYGANATGGWTKASSMLFTGLLLAATARVCVASLQWASRLYLLTNRRVVRFSGILEVHRFECSLARVGDAMLVQRPLPSLLGLGTLRVIPSCDKLPPVVWDHVSRPREIHEKLLRAIHRARFGE